MADNMAATQNRDDKVFCDPIHGHIKMPELCVKIIDTPQFQRLRHISQLAGNYYVYSGASHNRFEHSLGVCHLAGEMLQMLQTSQPELHITPEDILCVQVAGLCHDLGHGPFSHLFDKLFIERAHKQFVKNNKALVTDAMSNKERWKHEERSVAMFRHLLKENGLEGELTKADKFFIEDMILTPKMEKDRKSKRPNFMYQIVANKDTGIDVDKWDYFARDCHALGIGTRFDHTRLMKFARVIEVGTGKMEICYRDKKVYNVYEMFHTRAELHRCAYQHRVSVGIEMMLADALILADQYVTFRGKDGKCSIYQSIYDMKAFSQLNDQVFDRIILELDAPENTASKEASKILQRIKSRDLYKADREANAGNGVTVKAASAYRQQMRKKGHLFQKRKAFFDYGMKEENPVDKVWFYTKNHKPDHRLRKNLSCMLPQEFSKKEIRWYDKTGASKGGVSKNKKRKK